MDKLIDINKVMEKQNAIATQIQDQMNVVRKAAGLDAFNRATAIVDSLNAKNSVMAKVVGGVYHAPSAGDC